MELLFNIDKMRKSYAIIKNGILTYYCIYDNAVETKILTDVNHNKIGQVRFIGKLSKVLSWSNYEIEILNQKIPVHYKGIFNQVFIADFNRFQYKALLHQGYKISLFKNDVQIGYYDTKGSGGKENWELKIIMNDEEDDVFLILLCLRVYSNFLKEDPGGSRSNFNLGFLLRKFDKKWNPN